MSKFGSTLFSGSSFIYWSLVPILLVTGVSLSFAVEDYASVKGVVVVCAQVAIALLVLVLTDPKRFHWAARCLTGMVFAVYGVYLYDVAWIEGKSFAPTKRSDSEAQGGL